MVSFLPAPDIQSLVSVAIEQGTLSRRDHLSLSTAMLSNPLLTTRDRQYINQVFDSIRSGRVRLAD
ncbi:MULTISPECIES: hypothetical protein [Cyanophyceae]|uniref:hypothetical protein n=1 Tax=Cyanophyceae TaxID=3028117 RepID=UPI0016895E99|nr:MULTISPECIES: hypothetical protein [Cyanophyceae]MBD1918385.1 hypothetical protein [Phormidium sp. FACHB-77]MBD2028746.1 hypothetical protein [Phormidium sp. FACHB-322]MBD2051167.1 hypothetical protein [Leptolyngbya sp. FACHB-60]